MSYGEFYFAFGVFIILCFGDLGYRAYKDLYTSSLNEILEFDSETFDDKENLFDFFLIAKF